MIDWNDYYSGGYLLIRADKPDWPQLQDNDLLPDKLISLADCICPKLCVHWGWHPGNQEAALRFGIPQDRLAAFLQWCKGDYQKDLDIFCMFYSTDSARRFIDRFLPDTGDLYLIGIGLPKVLEEANWRGETDGEIMGIAKRIHQHLPLETGGTQLGFEVVSFEHNNLGHSWLCNALERDMHTRYGIRPNAYGLIDTPDEASKVWAWIEEDDRQGRRAEPVPYDFWLLVSYPLMVS